MLGKNPSIEEIDLAGPWRGQAPNDRFLATSAVYNATTNTHHVRAADRAPITEPSPSHNIIRERDI